MKGVRATPALLLSLNFNLYFPKLVRQLVSKFRAFVHTVLSWQTPMHPTKPEFLPHPHAVSFPWLYMVNEGRVIVYLVNCSNSYP